MSRLKKFLILDIVLLFLIIAVVVLHSMGYIGSEITGAPEEDVISEDINEEEQAEPDVSEESDESEHPEAPDEATVNADSSEWSLVLVNPWNRIPDDYFDNVKITETEGGYEIDSRVKESLEAMLADCREAGHSPVIISAFRTRDFQQYLYDRTANKNDTAVPGTSEHECGLAVDILEEGYGGDWDNAERTAETETQKWLTDNCQNYGFILRYPKGKEEITGIVYESWHYRYVGEENAKAIMESGQCLEEYLGKIDSDKEKIQIN